MKKILVVNAGSSSLKWAFYSENKLEQLSSGLCERINLDGRIILKFDGQKIIEDVNLPNHSEAVKNLIRLWKEHGLIKDLNEIEAIGFRTPYSGHDILSPAVYDAKVKSGIEEAKKFIPLHAPATLSSIEGFEQHLPNVKKIIAQDTAFHVTMPKINKTFPINKDWAKKFNIYKFGYHGLSHDYITTKMMKILGKKKVNIVVAHLGSGSSICAVKDSQSIDVSVGFSSLDGLMMGTRCGGIDPGIADYLTRVEGQDPNDVFNMMVKQSGLLGVSGISNDIRDLHELYEKNEDAKLAIDIFVSRIVDYIAMYLNKLGTKIDALVFTAGIGENDDIIRKMVIDKLQLFGLKLNQKENLEKYDDFKIISNNNSSIPIYKVRTDEEVVIARYVKNLIK
ncbi:acetate/propionate family kinase [Mycoplasma sp. Mirounga ES2805-ORL]|uniref:acetate/propionate family kinase n=1 Tax=Mycoplasma sp. Mirounga ES2805-ORL TaxID=754514 RepID=UPI00197C53F8|nr:acetate/propionate family kinase [Mycoplasma sp. Mirounga ES2805-ORL]QSF13738.1 acetate/propionate family kinase [Mycoplasma sp. Mirounga ES2805-ORL]